MAELVGPPDSDGLFPCKVNGRTRLVNPMDVYEDNLRAGDLVHDRRGIMYRLVARTGGNNSKVWCHVRNLNGGRFQGAPTKRVDSSTLRVYNKK